MQPELLKQDIHWIDSNAKLEQCCEHWLDLKLLALDTEFVRTTTYYPIAGLIQVNDGRATYLIDPLDIDDWYPLIEVLESDDCVIAMHACSEDLEVLQIEVGTVPVNILDTQLALGFLGGSASLGYAKAIHQELDVDIPKSETRSDWLQRPLSQPQIHYAALDVEYLYQLAVKLIETLNSVERLPWVKEEGRRLYKNFKQLQNANNSYRRIKSAWKLSPRKLAVLIELARWRENLAQQKDLPRNRVMKERTVFELALKSPSHISGLRKIEGVSEGIIRTQGATIISLIHAQQEKAEDELPQELELPLSKADQEPYKRFKSSVHELAKNLGVAPELLLRKKEIEALFRLRRDENWQAISTSFDGWRDNEISEPITNLLKELIL